MFTRKRDLLIADDRERVVLLVVELVELLRAFVLHVPGFGFRVSGSGFRILGRGLREGQGET